MNLLTYKNELSIILLRHKLMSQKYILYGVLVLGVIIGWNVFLIQRDQRLHDAYYRQQAVDRLEYPPSDRIDYNPKEEYCASLKVWHPDCNVE